MYGFLVLQFLLPCTPCQVHGTGKCVRIFRDLETRVMLRWEGATCQTMPSAMSGIDVGDCALLVEWFYRPGGSYTIGAYKGMIETLAAGGRVRP